jgi:hypothetical protein
MTICVYARSLLLVGLRPDRRVARRLRGCTESRVIREPRRFDGCGPLELNAALTQTGPGRLRKARFERRPFDCSPLPTARRFVSGTTASWSLASCLCCSPYIAGCIRRSDPCCSPANGELRRSTHHARGHRRCSAFVLHGCALPVHAAGAATLGCTRSSPPCFSIPFAMDVRVQSGHERLRS